MRNAAETFGLKRELMERWESLKMRGGPFRLVKGPVVMDDTVTARLREDVSPRKLLDLVPHPLEVLEGQAPHRRDSGPQAGRSWFPLRRDEDVGLVRVNEFKTENEVARCWTCSRSPSGSQGRLRLQYRYEKLVNDKAVSELKLNRAQGRVGPGYP